MKFQTTNAGSCEAGGGKGKPGFQPNNACAKGSGKAGFGKAKTATPAQKKAVKARAGGGSGGGKASVPPKLEKGGSSVSVGQKVASGGTKLTGATISKLHKDKNSLSSLSPEDKKSLRKQVSAAHSKQERALENRPSSPSNTQDPVAFKARTAKMFEQRLLLEDLIGVLSRP